MKPGVVASFAAAIALLPGYASAQAWTAQLVLSPFPSPYLSDWELDPSAGQLIVTNPTGTATDVTFAVTLTHNGQVLLRATSDPQTVPAGQSVFNAASSFGGRLDWNRDIQNVIARTGRLPEGEYEGCVTISGPGGVVLVPRQCARFATQSSDPPFLVLPANGDTVTARDPIFEWQPVQVPAVADARIAYVLQIAEVRTEARQRPEVALESNILHYVEPNLVQTSHQYPVGGLPLVSGRTYAWRVQALDGDGKPAAANQGRSEIWTFVYREVETETRATVASVALTPRRDTLRYVGDTSRFEARAYDADNVEIAGKRVLWRAIDTTIARVDSTGTVTATGAGETRIVASVDGIADTALSVLAASTTLAVRFATYDAAGDTPSLLELITSGTFEEVAPKLMALLQSGELRIPIPRLPGLAGMTGRAGDGGTFDDLSQGRGGPREGRALQVRRMVEPACADSAFNVRDPYQDSNKKVFVFYVPLNKTQRENVTRCLGVPDDSSGLVEETEKLRGALFVVTWSHPGSPRAYLAIKGPGLGLSLLGPKVDVRYLVINLTRALTVGSEGLPANFGGFFGDVSFDAGWGATYYSRRTCADASTPLCQFITWINPDNPHITINAFAGVTASETSVRFGSEGFNKGTSLALGFSIQASLPVRKWGVGVNGLTIDSTQIGILFAGQDSMETSDDKGLHHLSLSASPTLTAWWSGSRGNKWEFTGSAGVEIDPKKIRDAPKLVVSGQIPSLWKLWYIRLGNPQIVFTRLLEQDGTTELALSGTWGAGSWNGSEAEAIGVDNSDAGGSLRGDPGGAQVGGVTGFEQLGRGAVILKWEKREAPTAGNSDKGRTQTYEEATKSLEAARAERQSSAERTAESEKQCADLRRRYDAALDRGEATPILAAQRDAACEGEASNREETLRKLLAENEASGTRNRIRQAGHPASAATATAPAPAPAPCKDGGRLSSNGRQCFTWTAQLSLGNGSIVDLLTWVARLATGNQ